jgi:hypothetical protein
VSPWVYNPHTGGKKIPPAVQQRTEQRILDYAAKNYPGQYTRLDVRFRGALCYIDAYVEPEEPSRGLLEVTGETRNEYLERMRRLPLHLVRLRYFGNEDSWTLAFYTYSHEKYEPCAFASGSFHGTPEAAFDVGAVYLQG